MSVENGVVISFLNKDYELQSWNEQGEITQIKGMLTIAFLVVSPCSHIDNCNNYKKMLYRIIKILYLVNMPIDNEGNVIDDIVIKKDLTDNEEIELLKRALIDSYDSSEWKYYQPHFERIFKKYVDNLEKIKKLELKVNKLESEKKEIIEQFKKIELSTKELEKHYEPIKEKIEKLEKENLRLKIISGEAKSGWRKDRDWIERDEPKTGEPDGYKCPIIFDHSYVRNLKKYIHENKREKWCEFDHPYPTLSSSLCFFNMPDTAYRWLQGELPEQKKIKTKKSKIQKLEFKDKDEIIEQLENYYIDSNKNISQFKYLDNAIDFLWEFKDMKDKDKKFGTNDFRKKLDFCSPGTVDSYLDMFVECDIIIKLSKGSFRVNF